MERILSNKKLVYTTIAVLGVLLVAIIVLSWRYSNRIPGFQEEEPSPTAAVRSPFNTPAMSPTVSFQKFGQISPEAAGLLRGPVDFENITVDFRVNSGTFIVYHEDPLATAQSSFSRFMQKLSIPTEDFDVEYRDLNAPTLPPAYDELEEIPN